MYFSGGLHRDRSAPFPSPSSNPPRSCPSSLFLTGDHETLIRVRNVFDGIFMNLSVVADLLNGALRA